MLAGLHHPDIVRVVAFGQLDEGQPYVAMEWLEGEDLAQRQRRVAARSLQQPAGRGRSVRRPRGGARGGDRPPRRQAIERAPASAADPARATGSRSSSSTSAWRRPTTRSSRAPAPSWARPRTWRPSRRAATARSTRAPTSTRSGATLFEMITGRPPARGPDAHRHPRPARDDARASPERGVRRRARAPRRADGEPARHRARRAPGIGGRRRARAARDRRRARRALQRQAHAQRRRTTRRPRA